MNKITFVSIISIIFSIAPLLTGIPGMEALFLLVILPLFFSLGLLIKKWWICGALYIIVFLLARYSVFFGGATALAKLGIIAVVDLFVSASRAAYDLEK